MAKEFFIVLKKVVILDHVEDVMLDIPEDGYVQGVTEERGNHLIHHFDQNIDAMGKQEQLHLGKITMEVLHIYDSFIV